MKTIFDMIFANRWMSRSTSLKQQDFVVLIKILGMLWTRTNIAGTVLGQNPWDWQSRPMPIPA